MTYLDDILQKSQIDPIQTARTLQDLIFQKEPEIRKKIRERWLRGDSVDGGIIGVYRNSGYQLFKMQLNPLAGGDVDLTLTGALGRKIRLNEVSTTVLRVISDDPKFFMIGDKYGFKQFGLTEQEEQILIDEIAAVIMNEKFTEIYE